MLLHRDESNSDESPRRINDISPSDDKKKSKRKWVSKSNFLFKFCYYIPKYEKFEKFNGRKWNNKLI